MIWRWLRQRRERPAIDDAPPDSPPADSAKLAAAKQAAAQAKRELAEAHAITPETRRHGQRWRMIRERNHLADDIEAIFRQGRA